MDDYQNLVNEVKEEIGEDLFNKLVDLFEQGDLSIADIMQIPQEELDNLHQVARQALVRKEYEKAEKILSMLTEIAPDYCDYWVTYGNTLLILGELELAHMAYINAIQQNDQLIEAYVNAAECDLQMQSPVYALEELDALAKIAPKTQHDIELMNHAKKLRQIAENMESGEYDKPQIDAELDD